MTKKKVVKENVAVLGLVVLVTSVVYVFFLKFSSPIVVELGGYKISEPNPFGGDVKDFVILAKRFADTHNYNVSGYNCVNYTNDLKSIADSLGFETQVIHGCRGDDCHNWLRLEVDFEPQHGVFTDYSKKYPDQKRLS